jgi:2-C-methyl-D-erythritol 4-phosphate cytidylyltransferase
VGQPIDQADILAMVEAANPQKPVAWIQGGDTRQDSVCNGLAALPVDARSVLIHDGARCLVEPGLIDRCAAAVDGGAAVIAAAPVTDTIKRVDDQGLIQDTPDRSHLWGAQTPQGFPVEQLRQAHARARAEGWSVTDDASLFERLGWAVSVMESSPANIKITTPFDLTIAEAVLAARQA